MAETFLVRCLKPATNLQTFDDLLLAAFNSNALKLDFERAACTSINARKHIYRAYYQVQLWVQAPFRDASLTMDAEAYDFERRKNKLVPEIVISKPEGLPDPCTCGKCARKNGCCCRVAGIKCCKYCKFKGGDSNKHNNHVCTVYYNAKFNKISKYIRSYRVVHIFYSSLPP